MNELIEKLRSVKWEVIDDGDRMPDDPTHECVFVDMRPADFIALLTEAADALEAAREDAERLDWLASKAPHLYVDRDRGCYELPYFDITSGRECCDPGDLRAAIDQARGKENGNG